MKKRFALLLVLALIGSLSACAGDAASADASAASDTAADGAEASPEAGAADAPESYKIALYGPMTGNNAQYGETYRAVCELLVEQVNDAGGINGVPVELEIFDDKNDPREALNVANLIVSDPDIVAAIGSQTSSPSLAAAPVFAEAGLPMLSPQASHTELTNAGETIFSLCTFSTFEGSTVVEMMLEDGYANLAVIYANDDYGVNIVEQWTSDVEAAGATVVAAETYVSGQTTDFTPLLSKIKAAGADAIYIEPSYSDAAMILAQMKQLDMDIACYGSSMLYTQAFLDIAMENAEGLQVCNYINPDSTDPTYLAISEAYEAATGNLTDVYVTNVYDCFMLICDAIAAVGTDGAAMSEWIAGVQDWPGASGPITFDETRHPIRQLYAFEVQDGQFVYVGG